MHNAKQPLLVIENLHVAVDDKQILKGVDLTIYPGEIHAIMGPNGSGKSTLAAVLAGREDYTILQGRVFFDGKDLLEMSPEERAAAGLFLAFQYPVEIPGVSMLTFLRTALNEIRKSNGEEPIDTRTFLQRVREAAQLLGLGNDFLQRAVNVGFSGGEKKRNEILQMAVLRPKLAILDETDSGLDIDALKIVANAANSLFGTIQSYLIITHYQRLLNYIEPDYVHVMYDGKIVRSGDKTLALELEAKGYDWLRSETLSSIELPSTTT